MVTSRLTREQSREQTRQRLLDAARAVFLDKGYAVASIEEVTERAGYTRGAFYSNFDDKAQLLLLLLARDHAEMMGELRAIFDSAASRGEMEQRMLRYYSRLHEDNECFLLWTEAKLLAVRDPGFHAAFLGHQREMREAVTACVQEFSHRAGMPLTMPAAHMVLGLIALSDGMQFACMLDPQAVSAEQVRQVLAAFFQRVVLPQGGTDEWATAEPAVPR